MSNKTKSDSIEALLVKADNNDPVAMYQIAERLAEGYDGDTSDLDKALGYLEQASDNGYKPAAYKMYRILAGKEKVRYFRSYDSSGESTVGLTEINFTRSVDHEKAIGYLSQVTKSDALKDDPISALDNENNMIINGKLAWSDEYAEGKFLPMNIEKSVALTISIFQYIESHINHHLENINHLEIEEVSSEQDDLIYYHYSIMRRLLKTLILAYEADEELVSRELIHRVMLMTAKLIFVYNIRWEYRQDEHHFMELQSWEFNSLYDYPTRFNPDGNKKYIRRNVESPKNEKEDSRMSYIINFDGVDPYDAYIDQQYEQDVDAPRLREREFSQRQIENAVMEADSISLLLASKDIISLKSKFLNRFFPNLEFAYQYCFFLMVNHQNKEALDIYNNVINTHNEFRDKVSKMTFDLVKKFKEMVSDKPIMTFDDYKHNIYAETLAKDPCYLYEFERLNGVFHQEAYERCNFPVLKELDWPYYNFGAYIIGGSKCSIFDDKYAPEFTINKETYKYIKTLYKGGRLNGFDIEKNKPRSLMLNMRAAKFIVKYCRNHSPGDKHVKVYVKFLCNHIKLQKLQGKSIPDRYYKTLVSLGRSTDYKSDYQVLSNILYKEKNYLEKSREIMQHFKDMTSGMDFYYGTEDDDSLRNEHGYFSEKWKVYPVRYDARKKFNAFFLKNMKSLDQLAREENNPFQAFLCILLLMLADQWKNSNKDIVRWLASDQFHALDVENENGVPFQGIEELEDENIQRILYSLKNNEKNIDFSKAIDIDGYATYSDRVDTYISIASDGFVKIPELLFMRALLYLNYLVGHPTSHKSRLGKLTKRFYKRDLQIIEVVSQNLVIHDDKSYHTENEDQLVTYPFLNSLTKSSAYVYSESSSGIGKRNIGKSLQYVNDILRKNDEDEMVYACHPSLIQDAIALKIELEKELHGQQMEEINKKELELEVQKAKQNAASEKEREMLSFLTHTLRNSLANGPAQLKQSIRLLGTDDYDESKSKYKAINNIVSQLSTFSVVNTLITTFKQYVGDQESFLAQWYEDKQGKADINWVVSFCLRQCISRALFFPNYQRVIKRLIKDDSTGYIKKTRKNYIENILSLNDDVSPIEKISEWMKTYLPKLEVNIDENSPSFAVNNIKYTYLFSIFSEVIWNAFKHTDGEHPISIRWSHNKDHYLFTVENHYIEDEINLESSTNKGLIFIERLLSMFDNATLAYSKDESNTFVASIKLPYNIFS